MKEIAVVILNWNGKQLLEQFLPTLIELSEDAAIYVADNASTDNSLEYIAEFHPTVTIISNMANYGYAKGYNEALKYIKEPLYCLINSDIEVTENWLKPIHQLFASDEKIGIIQPKILDYKNKVNFEYAGAAGGFIDRYGFPFCRGRLFDTIEKDQQQYNDIAPIFWASGACFFIRQTVFNQLEGFDSGFFAHQEEIDLCWRAYNQDIKTYYCGKSTVYHVGGATLKVSNPQKTFLNYRNSLLMLYKNLPNNKKFGILFKRLCLDGISGVRLMLQLRPLHCFAIIRSHFAFYGLISSYKKNIQNNSKANYYYTNSIIWEYFIRKKKYFADIKRV